jgi:predicted nucleic acid binding AN1-type Zn finger protein
VSRVACRCHSCNKKVGLTGIECRCGSVYCGQHRYPEQHNCTFDFKAHDRANLQKTVVGGGEFSKMERL